MGPIRGLRAATAALWREWPDLLAAWMKKLEDDLNRNFHGGIVTGTPTEHLANFLLDRIEEEAVQARAEITDGLDIYETGWPASRVLAECDARRRIVHEWESSIDGSMGTYADGVESACLLLALPYADHPDYDERWRP